MQLALIIFSLVFFFPVGGFISMVMYLLYKSRRKDTDVDEDDLMVLVESNYRFYRDLNINDEINILPLNDVLTVAEDSIKRARFLETAKKDIIDYVRYMKMALTNEDGETSHYAAAIIQETKRKMDVKAYELMTYLREKPDDQEFMLVYADFLMNYLSFDMFQTSERRKFLYEYIQVAKKIIYFNKDEKYIIYLINSLIENKEFGEAKAIGTFFKENYKESPDLYLTNMKIYFILKDYDGLQDQLNDLRASGLTYDNVTLNKVRFWLGEQV